MHVHIYRLTRSKGENSFYRTLSENEWKISSAEYHDETGWKSRRARKSSLVDALFHGVLFCVFQSPGKLIVRSYPEVVLFIPTASSSRQCKILFFKILSSPLCVMISLVTFVLQHVLFARIYLYSQPRLALDLQTPTISTIILYLRSYIIHALRTIYSLSLSVSPIQTPTDYTD